MLDKDFETGYIISMNTNNFSPALPGSTVLYGACRPNYPQDVVSVMSIRSWMFFMKQQEINRVICLLSNEELKKYYNGNLIYQYQLGFGKDNVLHAPIADFSIIKKGTLVNEVIPFIDEVEDSRTVVHCSAGMGRTGICIFAWLVNQGIAPNEALNLTYEGGRNPTEAFGHGIDGNGIAEKLGII